MKKTLFTIALILFSYNEGFCQTSQTLSSTVPLTLTSLGNGAYNKSVLYHSTVNGFLLELAKLTDNNNSNPIDFNINARGATHSFFSIKGTTGNIGIGTITPDAKLSVNGNIHTKEVKVDLVGWPDYVFENTYNLPSLKQVEQHIKDKGHLQNIPSAKEVAKNGVLLGEMNKKLLQKIEELTLYTIAQEKKINSLETQKSRIEKLEKENKILKHLATELDIMKSEIKKLKKKN